MIRRLTTVAVLVLASAASAQFPASFNIFPFNGGNGTGSFQTTQTLTILDTTNQDVFEFTSFVVQQGHTLRITGPRAATIRVKGVAFIAGTIDLSGEHAIGPLGADGGPGGGRGGDGGNISANAEDGFGIGGGGSGLSSPNGGGSGGSNATQGQGPASPMAISPCGSGSGGGGGASGSPIDGGGGGGGGGTLKLLSEDFIQVGGAILANGGDGFIPTPPAQITAGGGGGSGGRILLCAPMVTIFGTLSAEEGLGGGANTVLDGGDGGEGCIEIQATSSFINSPPSPAPDIERLKCNLSAAVPCCDLGVGFSDAPGTVATYGVFCSFGEVAPYPVSGFTGTVEIDVDEVITDPSLNTLLFPLTGTMNFFNRTLLTADFTGVIGALESIGLRLKLELFLQALDVTASRISELMIIVLEIGLD